MVSVRLFVSLQNNSNLWSDFDEFSGNIDSVISNRGIIMVEMLANVLIQEFLENFFIITPISNQGEI